MRDSTEEAQSLGPIDGSQTVTGLDLTCRRANRGDLTATPSLLLPQRKTYLSELLKIVFHIFHCGVHRQPPHEDLLRSSDHLSGEGRGKWASESRGLQPPAGTVEGGPPCQDGS